MGDVIRLISASLSQVDSALSTAGGSPLQGGSGDGTSGGMEARLARVESDVGHLKASAERLDSKVEAVRGDVGKIKVDLATLTERATHLPTKGFIFSVAVALLGAAGALMAVLIRFLPHAQ